VIIVVGDQDDNRHTHHYDMMDNKTRYDGYVCVGFYGCNMGSRQCKESKRLCGKCAPKNYEAGSYCSSHSSDSRCTGKSDIGSSNTVDSEGNAVRKQDESVCLVINMYVISILIFANGMQGTLTPNLVGMTLYIYIYLRTLVYLSLFIMSWRVIY
jgi:hypothetical protein